MSSEFSKRSSSSSGKQLVLEGLTCDICPHDCLISSDSFGRCGVIQNKNSKLTNAYAGHCSNISVEPIEKRPFFHVVPGSKFLSVGLLGCNFVCKYCMNHRVSQQTDGKSTFYSPPELVKLALERNVEGIAFTYNEPIIYHDYIEEVGHEIGKSQRSSHLKLVVKTNGFAHLWVIRNICLYADAINVDIKGDDKDYENTCGGRLEPVLDCIDWIVRIMKVHLEISYLVLPCKIHDDEFNTDLCNWIADISPAIPVHLLYFYPFHRMVIPSYKPSELLPLQKAMSSKLDHVYISNYFGSDVATARDTVCRTCGNIMISRQKGSTAHNRACCGVELPGVFAK